MSQILYIRLPQLLKIVPVSPMTIWRWERDGLFPKRQKLGANVVAWRLDRVLDWCAANDPSGAESKAPDGPR